MKKFRFFLIALLFIGGIVYSQDGNDESQSLIGKVLQWITGGGIVTILIGIVAGWKKVIGFIGKVGLGLWDMSYGLANVLIQASEVSMKVNILGNKLAKYAEDEVYTKEELADLASELKEVAKEAKDVPPAIKELKEKFQIAIGRFKKK